MKTVLMALAGAALLAVPSHAAGYIKIGDVPGEVTAAGFEGWSSYDSAWLSVNQVYTESGARDASAPAQLQDLGVSRRADTSSPNLFEAAVKKTNLGDVIVVEVDEAGAEVRRLTLKNTVITSYSLSLEGGENLSLSYDQVAYLASGPVTARGDQRLVEAIVP